MRGEQSLFLVDNIPNSLKVSVCLPPNVNKPTVDELPLNKLSVELHSEDANDDQKKTSNIIMKLK